MAAGADIAIVIVAIDRHWLHPCLTTLYERLGEVRADVVVVDSGSTDDVAAYITREFPWARTLKIDNHGFAAGNNRAILTTEAPYVLLLNPDTEVLDGTIAELVRRLDDSPDIGIAGCRQTDADGELWPSMRRFPTAGRQLMEALGSERLPLRASWTGQRELDLPKYASEFDLDWTSGSFMLIRREALDAAGLLDERFFLYSEEVDLARRIKQAGYRVRHFPQVTILHHAGKAGSSVRTETQYAWSFRHYAEKHFDAPQRGLFLAAVALNVARRAGLRVLRGGVPTDEVQLVRVTLRALAGRERPPYEEPPPTALRPRSRSVRTPA